MSVYTLEEAKKRLKKALDAYDRALEKKAYGIGGRGGYSVEAQDIEKLEAQVKRWEDEVKRLENLQNGRRVLQIGSAVKR